MPSGQGDVGLVQIERPEAQPGSQKLDISTFIHLDPSIEIGVKISGSGQVTYRAK
jgi:hypothetical protein